MTTDDIEITVEVKSVNHRFLDVSVRSPRVLSFAEDELRRLVSSFVLRGHIDVSLSLKDNRVSSKVITLDENLLDSYIDLLKIIGDRLVEKGLEPNPQFRPINIMLLPDVVKVDVAGFDQDKVSELCKNATGQAMAQLNDMRGVEGGSLAKDINARLTNLETIYRSIKERIPLAIKEYAAKFAARVETLAPQLIDPQRLAQEVAIYADKTCIAEELTRLESHIAQMRMATESNDSVGRKLDFLTQELLREVNTIASKTQDVTIAGLTIEAKNGIEKIREQVQNVE